MLGFADIDPDKALPGLEVPGDWRRPAAAGGYRILWDEGRGYGQLWPRPTAREAAAFYQDADYYTHQSDRAFAGREVMADRLLFHMAWRWDHGIDMDQAWWSRLLGPGPSDVLEIGCGDGTNLARLAALGHRVTGVEPDPVARQRAADNGVEVFAGTAEDLPHELHDRRFHAVAFIHSLEHCLSPGPAMLAARRQLRPGGVLVAEVPNNECLGARHFGAGWFWLDAPRHLNYFTARSLQALVGAADLEVQRTEFMGFCRQFSADWVATHRHIAGILGLHDHWRRSRQAYWGLLARAAVAPDRLKYDSLRVVARRAAA